MDAFRKLKGGIIIVIIVIGLGFFLADRITTSFNIATVNGSDISYSDYRAFREAFEAYRTSLARSEDQSEVTKALAQLTNDEVDRITLEQIIGQRVLHEHVMSEFGLRAEDMIRSGLTKANARGAATAQDLNTPAPTFERLVLIPQIERAVAAELVRENGGDFAEWIGGHLASATVTVRWYSYIWENGTLKKK